MTQKQAFEGMAGMEREILSKPIQKVIEDIERDTRWYIKRYECKKDARQQVVYEPKEAKDCFHEQPQFSMIEGNLLLNEGIEELWKLAMLTGATKWDSSNAYLGTGTSTTAEAATQTGLITAPVYKGMMATFPSLSGTGNVTSTWSASFGSADANQAWAEFSLSNTALDTGKNLNRKVSAQGTKTSGQTWELSLAITLS